MTSLLKMAHNVCMVFVLKDNPPLFFFWISTKEYKDLYKLVTFMKYWNMEIGNGTLLLFCVVVTHCYCYFNNPNRTAMAFSAAALQI